MLTLLYFEFSKFIVQEQAKRFLYVCCPKTTKQMYEIFLGKTRTRKLKRTRKVGYFKKKMPPAFWIKRVSNKTGFQIG